MANRRVLRGRRLSSIVVFTLVVVGVGVLPARAAEIVSFDPSHGPEGASVVITGSGFTDTTSVAFGSVEAGYTVVSDTQISTAVPVGAATAPLVVTTPLGSASSADPFVVQPNIVIILTDDQRYDDLSNMPTVRSELMEEGVTFQNGFVPDPLCCPSRASILTGAYPGHTGVWNNRPPYDFTAFDDTSTIATWLHAGGYRTALIGKYLNGYKNGNEYIPPGWDRWVAFNGEIPGGSQKYYNYTLTVDGSAASFGNDPADYSTDVLAGYGEDFIADAPADQPLFLYFSPFAPHGPSIPPPRYEGAFDGSPIARPPNLNETDTSDKPAYIQALKLWTPRQLEKNDERRRRVLETLLGADDAVARILGALNESGRLSNTLIFYLSDNGFSFGAHRWTTKTVPYEESIRVPFIVRWDRLTDTPRTVPQLAVSIDIAPTIAQAAGASSAPVDGSSLLGLLDGSAAGWRSRFLIEGMGKKNKAPGYCGIRSQNAVFVHYSTGEEEFYRLVKDPYELVNQVENPIRAAVVNAMRNQARARCRPLPPGMEPF